MIRPLELRRGERPMQGVDGQVLCFECGRITPAGNLGLRHREWRGAWVCLHCGRLYALLEEPEWAARAFEARFGAAE